MLTSRMPLRKYRESVELAILCQDENTLALLLDDFFVDDCEAVLKPGKSDRALVIRSPDLKPP
jgi:hypothetical protein